MVKRWFLRVLPPLAHVVVVFGVSLHDQAFAQTKRDIDRAVAQYQQLSSQGRYSEAAQVAEKLVALAEQVWGAGHSEVSSALNNLGLQYWLLGRYLEAELELKRALRIDEAKPKTKDPDAGTTLHNLAALYWSIGRRAEAEALAKRSVQIVEASVGANHTDVVASISNLGQMYQAQKRFAEAEPLLKRALNIDMARLGPKHPEVGSGMTVLARLYQEQGRFAEAEPLMKQGLQIVEAALGNRHVDVATELANLADLYFAQSRYGEAEPLLKRAMTLREALLGKENPDTVMLASDLAFVAAGQKDWARALDLWRRSTETITRRVLRAAGKGRDEPGALTGRARSEAELNSDSFIGIIKALYRLSAAGHGDPGRDLQESFQAAQWALSSEAAASLAQMAVRAAARKPALAAFVRERQDLVIEWQARDREHSAAVAQPQKQRNRKAEAANQQRLDEIDRRVQGIDARLAAEFPQHSALASPAPLGLSEVTAVLRPDEALVLILAAREVRPLPEEIFVWVITRTATKWVRSDLTPSGLQKEVTALRCGLDATAWYGGGAARCTGLLALPPGRDPRQSGSLPFDPARAHRLYKALLGDVVELIKGKHLLFVPSGALTQLPLQVLVSAPPEATAGTAESLRNVRWLVRDHAVTVLPSVASLRALRENVKASQASRPMIGFGNPLLDGAGPADSERARLALARASCPVQIAGRASGERRAAVLPATGGLADVAVLRAALPLPETADELCAVANDLKVEARDIYLGARATVPQIQRLSDTGELQNYRLIHFATHGAVAGEVGRNTEPGLILTPPTIASAADDGYLSATRVAGLRLDADWVILSACNTAAGNTAGAEALSGLARAFFYAGARALLVSHWAVDSDATVTLITSAIATIAREPRMGRAEALRKAMLSMIDGGTPYHTHPAFWAPFIVVGEGAVSS